jgi:hypothetical protein
VPNEWVCLGHPASPLIMLPRKSCFRLIMFPNERSCDYVSSNSMLIFHCLSYLSLLSNRVQKLQHSGWNRRLYQISYRLYFGRIDWEWQYKHRQIMYKRNTETRSRNHCCRRKEVLHILSMWCNPSCPECYAHTPCYTVMSPVWLYNIFSLLFHVWHDCQIKNIANEMCFVIFSTASV